MVMGGESLFSIGSAEKPSEMTSERTWLMWASELCETWGRVFQAEGTARVKSLRQEWAWLAALVTSVPAWGWAVTPRAAHSKLLLGREGDSASVAVVHSGCSLCCLVCSCSTEGGALTHSRLPVLTVLTACSAPVEGDSGNSYFPMGKGDYFIFSNSFIGFCLMIKVTYIPYRNLRKWVTKWRA